MGASFPGQKKKDLQFNTIADLKASNPPPASGYSADVLGYYAVGDCEQLSYYWDSTAGDWVDRFTVQNGGSGYKAGDRLVLSAGAGETAAIVWVTETNSGVITKVDYTAPVLYAPPRPVQQRGNYFSAPATLTVNTSLSASPNIENTGAIGSTWTQPVLGAAGSIGGTGAILVPIFSTFKVKPDLVTGAGRWVPTLGDVLPVAIFGALGISNKAAISSTPPDETQKLQRAIDAHIYLEKPLRFQARVYGLTTLEVPPGSQLEGSFTQGFANVYYTGTDNITTLQGSDNTAPVLSLHKYLPKSGNFTVFGLKTNNLSISGGKYQIYAPSGLTWWEAKNLRLSGNTIDLASANIAAKGFNQEWFWDNVYLTGANIPLKIVHTSPTYRIIEGGLDLGVFIDKLSLNNVTTNAGGITNAWIAGRLAPSSIIGNWTNNVSQGDGLWIGPASIDIKRLYTEQNGLSSLTANGTSSMPSTLTASGTATQTTVTLNWTSGTVKAGATLPITINNGQGSNSGGGNFSTKLQAYIVTPSSGVTIVGGQISPNQSVVCNIVDKNNAAIALPNTFTSQSAYLSVLSNIKTVSSCLAFYISCSSGSTSATIQFLRAGSVSTNLNCYLSVSEGSSNGTEFDTWAVIPNGSYAANATISITLKAAAPITWTNKLAVSPDVIDAAGAGSNIVLQNSVGDASSRNTCWVDLDNTGNSFTIGNSSFSIYSTYTEAIRLQDGDLSYFVNSSHYKFGTSISGSGLTSGWSNFGSQSRVLAAQTISDIGKVDNFLKGTTSYGTHYKVRADTKALFSSHDANTGHLRLWIGNFQSKQFQYNDEFGPVITWASAAPTTGTYVLGSACYNSAPTAASVPFWFCTASGTPGTWRAKGGSSGTTASRPTLTANDAGYLYLDTTLNKPIYWTGTAWIDSAGAAV